MDYALVILLTFCPLSHFSYAQQLSFANTRFDLDPDLPVESTSDNEDQNPTIVELDPIVESTSASTSSSPILLTSQHLTTQTPLSTLPPSPSIPPSSLLPSPPTTDGPLATASAFVTPLAPIMTSPNLSLLPPQFKTPLIDPQSLLLRPAVIQPILSASNAASFVPQSPVVPFALSTISAIGEAPIPFSSVEPQTLQSHLQAQLQPQPQTPSQNQLQPESLTQPQSQAQPQFQHQLQPQSQLPAVLEARVQPVAVVVRRNILSNSIIPARLRMSSAALWFSESFDISKCSKEFHKVAMEFKRKFPQKAIQSGKDVRLADVLEERLTECSRKTNSNHWNRVAALLSKIDLSSREEAECRDGLIQERLACFNLVSFTCQFVQERYAFRLVPARIVIQEARLAEDGAEKCRKLVRIIKERSKHP